MNTEIGYHSQRWRGVFWVSLILWITYGITRAENDFQTFDRDGQTLQILNWQRSRLEFPEDVTGKGVTIAHISDGLAHHPDVMSDEVRKVWYVDPTDDQWGAADFEKAGGYDVMHDLFVATTVGGKGQFMGVAPNVNLLLVKGIQYKARKPTDKTPCSLDERGLVAMIHWIVDHKDKYQVRIITASLINPESLFERMAPWQADPVCRAIEYAASKGILVIWGVGNKRFYSAMSSSRAPSVLVVGGVQGGWGSPKKWQPFGHTLGIRFDGTTLPQLTAPVDTPCPLPVHDKEDLQKSWDIDTEGTPLQGFKTPYQFGGGTSYSGPYTAGLAALCLEVNPELTPAELRHVLISTADLAPNIPQQEQGAGVINPTKAIAMARSLKPLPSEPEVPAIEVKDVPKALQSSDPLERSGALLTLFSKETEAVTAHDLLPLLKSSYVESVCGVLTYLHRQKKLREKVMESGLGKHPRMEVKFAWGRIAVLKKDEAAIKAVNLLLDSGDKDLIQLGLNAAFSIDDQSLIDPIIGNMDKYPQNLQIQYWGNKALAKITDKRLPRYKAKDGSGKRSDIWERRREQWKIWRKDNPGK